MSAVMRNNDAADRFRNTFAAPSYGGNSLGVDRRTQLTHMDTTASLAEQELRDELKDGGFRDHKKVAKMLREQDYGPDNLYEMDMSTLKSVVPQAGTRDRLIKKINEQRKEHLLPPLTKQIAKSMSKNDLLQAIKALDNRVESLAEDVQTQVSKLGLEVLGKMDNNLPRLFVVLPEKWFKEKDKKRFGKVSNFFSTKTKWRILLLCEGGEGFQDCHIDTSHIGYKVGITKDWLRKSMPVIKVGLKILSIALLAASSGSINMSAVNFLPKDPGPIFELAGEMGQATGEELDDIKMTAINDLMDSNAIKESSRMLKILLGESNYDATKEKPNTLGGLSQQFDKNHNAVWVCKDHHVAKDMQDAAAKSDTAKAEKANLAKANKRLFGKFREDKKPSAPAETAPTRSPRSGSGLKTPTKPKKTETVLDLWSALGDPVIQTEKKALQGERAPAKSEKAFDWGEPPAFPELPEQHRERAREPSRSPEREVEPPGFPDSNHDMGKTYYVGKSPWARRDSTSDLGPAPSYSSVHSITAPSYSSVHSISAQISAGRKSPRHGGSSSLTPGFGGDADEDTRGRAGHRRSQSGRSRSPQRRGRQQYGAPVEPEPVQRSSYFNRSRTPDPPHTPRSRSAYASSANRAHTQRSRSPDPAPVRSSYMDRTRKVPSSPRSHVNYLADLDSPRSNSMPRPNRRPSYSSNRRPSYFDRPNTVEPNYTSYRSSRERERERDTPSYDRRGGDKDYMAPRAQTRPGHRRRRSGSSELTARDPARLYTSQRNKSTDYSSGLDSGNSRSHASRRNKSADFGNRSYGSHSPQRNGESSVGNLVNKFSSLGNGDTDRTHNRRSSYLGSNERDTPSYGSRSQGASPRASTSYLSGDRSSRRARPERAHTSGSYGSRSPRARSPGASYGGRSPRSRSPGAGAYGGRSAVSRSYGGRTSPAIYDSDEDDFRY